MIINPILRGFSPDPSIIRVEDDYYIATSTFQWWPGVHLFHSTDLKSWEQLPSPLNRLSQLNMLGNPDSGGIWAPCLSYSEGIFYLVYTDVKTKKGRYYNNHNYVVTATSIYGPWSEPVYLNSTGFDPSLFHDHDGKKYLVNMHNGFKGILMQQYNPEKKQLIGQVKNIFPGSGIGCTEGPHLYHIGDWYYIIAAEGGTGYEHCVTVARAKSIEGPYTVDPENPMLSSGAANQAYLKKCGHADIVESRDGQWYMVHLCSRPRPGKMECLLGRETALQRVYWSEDGWLRLWGGAKEGARAVSEPQNLKPMTLCAAEKDDFDTDKLDISYASPRVPLGAAASLTERKGYLRLYGQESLNSLHHVSLLAKRQMEYSAYCETKMAFAPKYPEQLAGLTYYYDAQNYYLWAKSCNDDGEITLTLIQSDAGVITDIIPPIPLADNGEITLKIATNTEGSAACFSYSFDGGAFTAIDTECPTSILTDEHCRGFTGAHFGMFCFDMTGSRLYADFDYFIYHDDPED
jgi:xylan 1,4-beta-xylosidase